MRISMKSITLMTLGSLLLATGVEAQASGGAGAFQWYVGGNGGVTSFRTPEGRQWIPTAGGHFLITAKRTALLLSVDQGFGDDEVAMTQFEVRDSVGNVTDAGLVGYTYDGIRRYSAVLLAYPIQNRNVQPYVGVGAGIAHYTGTSQGPFADKNVEDDLSSTGFATALLGLEFRVGPLSAFGHYQVTTKHGFKQAENVLRKDAQGKALETRLDFGEWTQGAHHSLIGGLRFSLGGSRESVKTGGYK